MVHRVIYTYYPPPVCKQSRQFNDRHKNERDTRHKYAFIWWCEYIWMRMRTLCDVRRASVIKYIIFCCLICFRPEEIFQGCCVL